MPPVPDSSGLSPREREVLSTIVMQYVETGVPVASRTLAKLNTEEAPSLAAQYNIRSIPTLAVFRSGREVARQMGALGGPQLIQWIQANAG